MSTALFKVYRNAILCARWRRSAVRLKNTHNPTISNPNIT